MNVFVTGATGFIGSAIIQDLIGAGHRVLGLARSDEGARALAAAGAEVHRGHLEDLASLAAGAAKAEAVIHTAFIHDFNNWAANGEIDRRAIGALGEALAGTDRPLIVTTSGVAGLVVGRAWPPRNWRIPSPPPRPGRRKRPRPRPPSAGCASPRCGCRLRFMGPATTASCRA